MARLVKRRCGYCSGTGKVDTGDLFASKKNCPVCDGFTFVSIPSDFKKCPDCGGKGKKDIGTPFPEWVRCKRCNGTGWTEPPLPYR